ncbi:MAG: thiosulfate oxidation carrier complex protein SoxZ [Burkholderiales bacterium]
MTVANVRIDVPAIARRGEIIDIKTLVAHGMETGFRRTHLGVPIPRDIITTFVCLYNSVEVFRAELHPSISANPFLQFSTVATESGTLEFKWSGDNGFSAMQTARISVA